MAGPWTATVISGVHDEPLTHVNWMLYRLTGFNYFKCKRWFSGFPVYMSYMNAVGNPGVPFSDGGDSSPGVPYLTEMLAYLCPDNPAESVAIQIPGPPRCQQLQQGSGQGLQGDGRPANVAACPGS